MSKEGLGMGCSMLFKTNNKLFEYAELTAATNFNSVKPTLRVVETQHIIPFLGTELYNSLNAAYTSATDEATLTAQQTALLDQCRCVIGPMLCYYYAPKAEVKLSDSGAQRMETTNAKTAYQNQVTNYREQNLREGEMATENLLQFLEDNKGDYPQWTASTAFTDYRSLFIKSGGEFNKIFPSGSPYRNYWAMRSQMTDVEESTVRSLLGDTIYNALKAKGQGAEDFTAKEADLLSRLKRLIAYQTLVYAIPLLNVRIDANGITVMSLNHALNDNLRSRVAAGKDDLNVIIEKCQAAANSWKKNVTDFLNANATEFTGWPLSPELVEG
ncbi:MAG: DUF6712 family protein, partial [Mucilaginibacter sp.]